MPHKRIVDRMHPIECALHLQFLNYLRQSDNEKKLEEEYLAESLRGHITYFVTRYRKSHDQEGRACILMYPNYTIKCKRKQPNIKYFLFGLEYSKILLLYRF